MTKIAGDLGVTRARGSATTSHSGANWVNAVAVASVNVRPCTGHRIHTILYKTLTALHTMTPTRPCAIYPGAALSCLQLTAAYRRRNVSNESSTLVLFIVPVRMHSSIAISSPARVHVLPCMFHHIVIDKYITFKQRESGVRQGFLHHN
ncbi:hypothetical protein J6590_094574 [Homalodisca vitripennis]|nr:hypothetical protein J6590_041771 [Homalodisca vitripennis]KAG8299693.1 hypothetical protein J6590_094574 [Homalodisca vitripennis]